MPVIISTPPHVQWDATRCCETRRMPLSSLGLSTLIYVYVRSDDPRHMASPCPGRAGSAPAPAGEGGARGGRDHRRLRTGREPRPHVYYGAACGIGTTVVCSGT